jgi:N-dimethylarginine dimethylaminohydrolase
VHGLALTSGAMYHLDLAFCPLDDRRALVCPGAFDEPSRRALLDLVPEPIVVTEEEALATFCTNSVVVGRTVVMPACPGRVRSELECAGFRVVEVDVSEFHKGGGSIRCLTNPLDITLARDLDVVPGGDVVLPLR